jgi:hypothetical protein
MRILLTASFVLSLLVACGGSDKAILGEACEAGADCEGLVCLQAHVSFFGALEYPGGYCTNGECNSSNLGSDCDAGDGICLIYSPTGDYDCYLRCVTDEECGREDYGCLLLDEEETEGACIPIAALPPE